MIKSICVFCGSSAGKKEIYTSSAVRLGQLLAENEIALVYGGGKVGLMGKLADAALKKGGEVFGVIPRHLVAKEVAHEKLTKLHIVDTMHQRKEKMYELSGAFIAMPGGFGTLDEFCEILTWWQLGFHQKPIAFLNTEGYFDHLINHFAYAVSEGFVKEVHNSSIMVESNPALLLEKIMKRSFISGDGSISKA